MRFGEGGQKGRSHPSVIALRFSRSFAIKNIGHENQTKGLGFSALGPSLPRTGRDAAGAEEPGQRLQWFCGLLLQQELPHAFVTFFHARLLPNPQSASLEFQGRMCVQLFAHCTLSGSHYASAFNL